MKKITSYGIGVWAERYAALYLWVLGYRIRDYRYKTPVGEIDLVVTRGQRIVFVEVKARSDSESALSAIRTGSFGRLRRAALHYISRHPAFSGYEMRFDLIAISFPFSIRHLDNIDLEGA